MKSRRHPQTWPYLKDGLKARRSLLTDLRNDHGGDELTQVKSIILRYLETVPAQSVVTVPILTENVSRHWPFHGKTEAFFQSAINDLKKEGWIKETKEGLSLDKVARVTRKFLASKMRRKDS